MKPENRILALADPAFNTKEIKGIGAISHVIVRRRSYAIEIDFHTDDPEEAEKQLKSLGNLMDFRRLNEENIEYNSEYFNSLLKREKEIIEEARRMFREERYWEAHTVLEDLWKATKGNKKKLLQGAIIIAASMTHYQMNEMEVAERMYKKGLAIIRSSLPPGANTGLQEEFLYPAAFPDILTS